MSGKTLLKPLFCNSKEGQDGAIFLLKFEAWGGTQDMGALFDAVFETTLPSTEASNLDLTKPDEKAQDDARRLNALRIGALAW